MTWVGVRFGVRARVRVSQGLTSEKKSERMTRLIQWRMPANWKALETVENQGEDERRS